MPGDELHDNAAAGARSGPRHAAPKKPLLTRLHVPAGKAIAIAAMPSAVLMGMGLTPQMAIAKPAPKSPFKDGPCVTAPDKVEKDSKDGAKDEKDDTKPSATPSAKPSPSAGKESGSETPAPEPSGSKKTDEPSGSATPSPSASEEEKDSGGLLDGVGDALGGLLGTKDSEESEEPSTSPSPTPSASKSATEDAASATDKATEPVKDTVDGLKAGADKAGEPTKDAKDTVDDTVHGAVGTVDNALPGGGLDGKDASGKKSYPCVVENKVKGANEEAPTTVPNEPWELESSALTLRDLDYKGVVNLKTPSGKTKQALKFTSESIDIGDLHQIVQGPSGEKYHVQAAKGSTSTIRGGTVTMYTERLEGNLFGLIPIVFDPEHPPPINVPFAYFTKVKILQAGQFGGNLTVPGMHQSIED
ncbi:hypothetical protein [Streptomyces sp. NPDC017993]|uniref:hypothetical protein n=1 Tax=Streptomyces sp. NPDC017993 TaxID=3365027 RepID=UPI0037B6BB3F